MYRRVCALLTAFLFLVPAAGCAKTEKPGGSSNPASGTPSSEIAMTGEATSTTAASGTTETNTTGSWDRNDANKVTKTNGFTYEGIKPNSKKVTLPKSSSQYTGEIVLVENMEKYVPDGDNGYDTGFLLLALQGLAKSLAADYASFGVTVNCVMPSMMETKFLADTSELIVQASAEANPMKRNARVEDVVPAMAFLLSEEAGFITGVTLPVTGGSAFL